MSTIPFPVNLAVFKTKVKGIVANAFIILSSLVFILSCNNANKEQPITAEAALAPDSLQLIDLKGQPLSLQQFQGRVLFVNFWATWCKPCILEMPSIANAQKALGDKVIFINASPESLEEIESFRLKNSYPFLFASIENMESLGITALPTTFIFSANGKLVFSESGARKWDDSSSITLIHQIVNNE